MNRLCTVTRVSEQWAANVHHGKQVLQPQWDPMAQPVMASCPLTITGLWQQNCSIVQAHLEFVSNSGNWWAVLCAAEPAYLDSSHTFDRLSFESLAAACRDPALSWQWQPLLECILLCCISQCALHCMIKIEHVCAMALAVNIVVIATVGIA